MMEKEENKVGLVQAMLNVMDECKGIEKNTKVGSGNYGYKGVSDKDVKEKIGGSLQKNGLVILPIDIEESVTVYQTTNTTTITSTVNGVTTVKEIKEPKKSFFTKVKTKYKIMHISGETEEVAGYGHGVDSQDKGAGKATTYALKYVLMYISLVASGKIDDTDATHSKEIEEPPKEKEAFTQERLDKLIVWAEKVEEDAVIENLLKVKKDFKLSGDIEGQIDLYLDALKKGKKSQQKK